MALSVGVVGASGYGGGELLRLLASHPEFTVVAAAAGTNAGEPITSVHPGLLDYADLSFQVTDPADFADLDLVFVALPHGTSAQFTDALPTATKVVDLGADHRLSDPQQWDRFYGGTPMAQPWVYGLPELPGRREVLTGATKVAAAGCYATAIQLSLAGLLSADLIEPTDITVVAASGTSGAGRKAAIALSAAEVMGSMSVYKVGGVHQHTAEIVQELSGIAGADVTMSFTPLLAPMPRGIIATSSARVRPDVREQDLREAITAAYKDSPFVHVLDAGNWPTTAATAGSNSCQLQVALDPAVGRAVVVAAIDNLGKGAAGQAIQCANLMTGQPETAGLSRNGVTP